MAKARRKVGQPVEKALRRTIVRRLKAGDAVATVARELGLVWATVNRIRGEENIPARKTGINSSVTPPEAEARILARLKDPNRPGEARIAAEEGVSRAVVMRIRQEAGIPPREKDAGPKLDASAETRAKIGLADENARLRAEIKRLHRAELDDAAIREILGGIAATPVDPPDWLIAAAGKPDKQKGPTPEVPVTIWSDWHLGEVVSRGETSGINEYSPEIAERRIRRLVETTVRLARDYHVNTYPGVVVNLLGDFVSGGLHPELLRTDAEEVIPSALRARDILVWALDRMIEAFGRVYVPCAAGNHGRATQKPEFKRYVYKNFDWLIYQLLARHFAGRKGIVIDVPEANEVHYRVFGQRYLAMHGDHLGVKGGDGIIGSLGPIARGEVKVGKQSSAIGRDYDVLLIGHWHQPLWLPRVIVANSLKGWDEYASKALRAPPSEPSQPLWFVHPRRGVTAHW